MSRNLFIDYLKGIAIFLVVWGHGLQFLDSEYNCYGNYVFLFIYSFHMPLFMCVSGYLFAFSVKKKSFNEMFLIKFKQLMIPVLCWGFLFTWLVYYKELRPLDAKHLTVRYIWLYIRSLPYHLWFLWSLFVISVISSLLSKRKNIEVLLHVCTFFLLLCLPDNFGLSYVKFMYPFFLMGYFYNKYAMKIHSIKKYVVVASFIIFPLCFFGWSKIDLIYFTPMSFYKTIFIDHLYIILLRYVIGFTGVIVVVTLIKRFLFFPKLTFVTTMGLFSLGIYIIQSVLNYIVKIYFSIDSSNVYLYTFVYTILFALLSIVFSIVATKWIGKIPFLSRILFGGRY